MYFKYCENLTFCEYYENKGKNKRSADVAEDPEIKNNKKNHFRHVGTGNSKYLNLWETPSIIS